jgi:peroxiredoxin
VQILGISADNPFAQKAFADSLALPYPLISDAPDMQVTHSYGVVQQIGTPGRSYPQRSFFLIDQQGIVRGKWLGENQEVFASDPILKAARELAGR